jgi:hypothetical protein
VINMARDREAGQGVSTNHGDLVSVTFFQADNLPAPLAQEAKKQGVELKPGLLAVRLFIASPPRYEFESIGSSPADVKAYYTRLAAEDGETLDGIASRLSSE